MFEKFDWMLARYQELSEAVSQPEIIADQARWQRLLKEHAALEPAVEAYRAYQKTLSDLAEARRDADPARHGRAGPGRGQPAGGGKAAAGI